jgi:bifunctional non-homologous end joining protein LigD
MWRDDPASVRPMLATTTTAPLTSATLAYERKYDGIRAIALVDPACDPPVRLWSRLGNDKTDQFSDVADRLEAWGLGLTHPVILDGEIVALDERGHPVSFQHLQSRMHLQHLARSRPRKTQPLGDGTAPRASRGDGTEGAPTAFIAFDLLRDGDQDVRAEPLRERRRRLEALFADIRDPQLRLSEQVVGDGRALQARAVSEGWEGLIAKRLDSTYASGRRSPDWRKLKLERRQTCVVGGWTEPRGSRTCFGSLILGVYDEKNVLKPIGHVGSGFSDAELQRVWTRLAALESTTCPFSPVPRTNEPAHWVRPALMANVKFTEWTTDGQLRHPTYIGLRDDATVTRVRREPDVLARTARVSSSDSVRAVARVSRLGPGKGAIERLLDQVDALEHNGGGGTLHLPSGDRLEVSNLGKVFWPKAKHTKGDLFRHYIQVAPYILPALADRPLVMKRFPNGVDAKPFYQQRAPDVYPRGVRIELVSDDHESVPRIVGGSLTTLLYTVQLASISQDPWLSRVQSDATMDHAVIDLDPPDDVPFRRVLDVARWVREELDSLNVPAFPKLSGAGGLHIYVPMPSDTPYEAGLLFCQIIATIVSTKHPKAATIERSIKARGARVYVDYLQNGHGKTLASVYSARATDFAGVSAPVTWEEVDDGVTPRDFTIRNFAERLEAVGDLWALLRKSKGANLRAVMKSAQPSAKSKGARFDRPSRGHRG